MSDYDKQARAFLKKTGVTMTAVFLKHAKHFEEDTASRDIYQIVLSRGDKGFSFAFGQSLKDSDFSLDHGNPKKPSAYDVLACLTKYEPPTTLDDFASEYGYMDKPSLTLSVYNAVREEWRNVSNLWTPEEIEELAEIN